MSLTKPGNFTAAEIVRDDVEFQFPASIYEATSCDIQHDCLIYDQHVLAWHFLSINECARSAFRRLEPIA